MEPRPRHAQLCHIRAEHISDSLRNESDGALETLKERGIRGNILTWIPSAKISYWEFECVFGGRSLKHFQRLCRSFSKTYSVLADVFLCALAAAGYKEVRPLKVSTGSGGS